MTPFFSIIVPVYNRPDELLELLGSLRTQQFKNFELLVIEDGSSLDSAHLINEYQSVFSIQYQRQENSGPAIARNTGMALAKGEYFLFIDSDCIAPDDWLQKLADELTIEPVDAFGGPDLAAPDFSLLQKAISFAMTSFLTTGGIRGRKKQVDKFHPRSFNMGIHRKMYDELGGFPVTRMHPGEDMVFTIELMKRGFSTRLFHDAGVYHKRRSTLKGFYQQVFKFGKTRYIIGQVYPETTRLFFWIPSILVILALVLITLSVFTSSIYFITPLVIYAFLVFAAAAYPYRCFKLGLLSIVTAGIQIIAYGVGFLSSVININLLRRDEYAVLSQGFYPPPGQD